MDQTIDRNLALELAQVTEAVALITACWMGGGDERAADQAPVDTMRLMLGTVQMDGIVVIGGAPEAVIAACALKCIGGDIQCRLWPRNDEERRIAAEKGINLAKVHGCDDLVRGTTQPIVMRSRSGTFLRIDATHRLSKLRQMATIPFD